MGIFTFPATIAAAISAIAAPLATRQTAKVALAGQLFQLTEWLQTPEMRKARSIVLTKEPAHAWSSSERAAGDEVADRLNTRVARSRAARSRARPLGHDDRPVLAWGAASSRVAAGTRTSPISPR
jgi:hypothetical protein